MTLPALGLAFLLRVPAAADVTLVQVVQAQSQDGDGLLAKSLIEVARGRMRLVTAVAPKLADQEAAADPWRLVQVLDLATTSLWVIDPDARTYEQRPLGAALAGPAVPKRAATHEVASSVVTVVPGKLMRRRFGADCLHWKLTGALKLRRKGRKGPLLNARLEQDVWVASLAGQPQKALLDLIAFEAAFRRQAGTDLSPIDQQTYRIRESAQYLGVAPREVEAVAAKARRALSGLTGYPLTSSVTWWTEKAARPRPEPKASKTEPRFMQDPPPAPARAPLKLVKIDWRAPWGRLDTALARAQAGFGAAPAGAGGGVLEAYDRFQADLRQVVEELDRPRPAEPDPQDRKPADSETLVDPAPLRAPERVSKREARAYEAFADIGELLFVEGIPDDHFRPPKNFRKK